MGSLRRCYLRRPSAGWNWLKKHFIAPPYWWPNTIPWSKASSLTTLPKAALLVLLNAVSLASQKMKLPFVLSNKLTFAQRVDLACAVATSQGKFVSLCLSAFGGSFTQNLIFE